MGNFCCSPGVAGDVFGGVFLCCPFHEMSWMKQDESQGCLNTNNYKGARPMAFGWGKWMQRGGGQKR